MADGPVKDEDWFERAVREHRQTAGDGSEENEETDAGDTADRQDTDAGQEGSEAEPDLTAGESGDQPPAEDRPDARATMDDIAAAFGVDRDEAGSPEVPQDVEESFGFDLESPGGAGGSFGFGVSQEYDTFEEEEYHTEVPRIDIGIDGLDEMIQGGIPERALIVTIGGAGTGKTTFGLQFLNEALANDERGVFITLEESRDRILQSAREKGWPFEEYAEDGSLAVIDLDPVDMANSLTSIRNELPRLVEDFGASRLVLDSVSLLEMMYEDQATRRTEIYDFARSLKRAGVTTMLTSESDEDNPFASRYGVIEYLTDAVVILRYVRPEDFRETRLAIEIQKIRDANHSRETKPYEITSTGISVYRQANIF